MQDTVSQYIATQLAAAKAERERKYAEAQAEEARELATRKAISLKNTLRALSLIGIEATESELECSEEGFYSLLVDGVRLSLKIGSNYNHGKINELQEVDYMPSAYDQGKGQREYHDVRFTLFMSIVGALIDMYPDYESSRSDYHEYEVQYRSDYNFYPERLPETDITNIFGWILQLKERLEARAQFTPAPRSENPAPKKPRFSYAGESREEILAEILHDIQSEYYPAGEF